MNNLPDLVDNITRLLRIRNLKIAAAESCTGGLIAAQLTELAGSSQWFERGFVTYSNLAKQEMLGVKEDLIRKEGAVSQAVAEAMALGALTYSVADVALAVTGIAGPDGGTAQKPVGTVWFAWARRHNDPQSLCCFFPNLSRQEVRHQACIQALQGIITVLPNLNQA